MGLGGAESEVDGLQEQITHLFVTMTLTTPALWHVSGEKKDVSDVTLQRWPK